MHRIVKIQYRKRVLHFIAGPYMERVPGTLGVKLAQEIAAPCDIDLPAPDFSTWDQKAFEDALMKTISLSMAGEVPYIGCFAGQGRTGTFLAALFRCLSDSTEDPVKWVRRVYNPHAVETEAQAALVSGFDVQRVHDTLHLDPDGRVTIEEFFARMGSWLRQRLPVKQA